MGGANLEIFKFGFYLFFPIAVMAHFGDPQWYDDHVAPYRRAFWPDPATLSNPPKTREGMEAELARIKQERAAIRHAAAYRAAHPSSEAAEQSEDSLKAPMSTREYRHSGAFPSGLLSGYTPREKWV